MADCAVVGVGDADWGERVCMALVVRLASSAAVPPSEDLRAWGKQRMAAYKVPSRFAVVDDLPRNALGKVVKAQVTPLFD